MLSKILESLNVSDVIELIGIFASLITSIIAIKISLMTLRQNSKMIEESTRPYIGIYGTYTFVKEVSYYIVVKNFGASSARILSFDYDANLDLCIKSSRPRAPFKHLVDTTIMPGQSFKANIDLPTALKHFDSVIFSIKYSYGKKIYTEEIVLNLKADSGNSQIRLNEEGKELRSISLTLQDIDSRLL